MSCGPEFRNSELSPLRFLQSYTLFIVVINIWDGFTRDPAVDHPAKEFNNNVPFICVSSFGAATRRVMIWHTRNPKKEISFHRKTSE